MISHRARASTPSSLLPWALGVCLCILLVALATSPAFLHWFIVPLFGCGVICCADGVQIFQNRGQNLFDPVPLLGMFGLFFFYIGPMLHVAQDYWFISSTFAPTDRPDDWRPLLGYMGFINLLSLLIYRACHMHSARAGMRSRSRTLYRFRTKELWVYGLPLLTLALSAQVYVYAKFGGIAGYVRTYADANLGDKVGFTGLGWAMCIAESFPILLLIFFIAACRPKFRQMTALKVGTLLGVLFILILVFGGLRGSRSNTVISLVYAVGAIHVMVHKLTARFFATLGIAIVAFMYFYGFYKVSPQTFLTAVTSSEERAVIGAKSGRTLDEVLLGDFERSDIQAYLLFRIMRSGSEFEYAYGETYFDATLIYIPRAISSFRPPGKVRFGTNAIFGEGAYSAERFAASKIYGLAGETMLNFGPCAIPIAFAVFGVIVGRLRSFSRSIDLLDSRQLIVPILTLLCVTALSSDVDNIIYTFLEHALMPSILILSASRATRHVAARSAFGDLWAGVPMRLAGGGGRRLC